MVFKATANLWQSNFVKADGTATLYIRVRINGNSVPQINLEISWPPDKVDLLQNRLRPLHKDDQVCSDYNLMIDQMLGRCNEIFREFRLANRQLVTEDFLQHLNDERSRTDFIEFYAAELEARRRKKNIANRTYLNHNNTLNKLRGFKKELSFAALNWRFGEDFDDYLIYTCGLNKQNTRWTHHRDIKTYLARAKESHVKFEDPYSKFSISEVDGDWQPLRTSDLPKLKQYYDSLPQKHNHREPLRKFLFSCYSGLRISDIKRAKPSWVNFETKRIYFRPKKQMKFDVTLDNRLNDKAAAMIKDAIAENTGPNIFRQSTEQYENRLLHEIEKQLEISAPMHFHAGRHTYCTMFIERGGSEAALRKNMGWKKTKMAAKYVKPHQEVIDAVVDRM